MISGLRDKWETLTPKNKQKTLFGGVFAVIIVGILLGSEKKAPPPPPQLKNEIKLIDVNSGSMDMEQLVGQNKLLSTKVSSLQENLEALSEHYKSMKRTLALNNELTETPQILYNLKREIESLKKEQKKYEGVLEGVNISSSNKEETETDFVDGLIDDTPKKVKISPVTKNNDVFGNGSLLPDKNKSNNEIPDNPIAYVNAAFKDEKTEDKEANQYINMETNPNPAPGAKSGKSNGSISIIVPKKNEEQKANEKAKEIALEEEKWEGAILPAGTLIPGIVISGVDAPTGKAADKGAAASTIRITGPAILPNGERVDLEGCFVVNDVRGDLATQRAIFRPQTLTCMLEAGVVDTSIQGYISGKDGSVGFRGKVVNKQGSALLYSAAAGVVGGFGNAFGGGNSNSNIVTGGQFELPTPEEAATAGFGQGLSEASSTLADYYKEQLDLLYPIIEIKPMIFGSIHLLKTVQLRLYKKQLKKAKKR